MDQTCGVGAGCGGHTDPAGQNEPYHQWGRKIIAMALLNAIVALVLETAETSRSQRTVLYRQAPLLSISADSNAIQERHGFLIWTSCWNTMRNVTVCLTPISAPLSLSGATPVIW